MCEGEPQGSAGGPGLPFISRLAPTWGCSVGERSGPNREGAPWCTGSQAMANAPHAARMHMSPKSREGGPGGLLGVGVPRGSPLTLPHLLWGPQQPCFSWACPPRSGGWAQRLPFLRAAPWLGFTSVGRSEGRAGSHLCGEDLDARIPALPPAPADAAFYFHKVPSTQASPHKGFYQL